MRAKIIVRGTVDNRPQKNFPHAHHVNNHFPQGHPLLLRESGKNVTFFGLE